MNKNFINTYAYTLHNEQKLLQSVLSGLDCTGLASDPLNRTGLDQDHRLTDLDWTGFFQMNPFHTLVSTNWKPTYVTEILSKEKTTDCGHKNATFSALMLDAGVSQGSVLGPLLAILYLNGLCDETKNKMLFYADYCSLYYSYPL